MKPLRLISIFLPASALGVFLALVPGARATDATAAVAVAMTNAVDAATNSAPAIMPVALAIFNLGARPTKDPFFPLSLRQPTPAATNSSPTFSSLSFNLKGLSGSADRRLALLNNRTVAVGESAEITTPSGKIKIHCVEIKESSVIIRAETQPDLIEIFLRKSAQ